MNNDYNNNDRKNGYSFESDPYANGRPPIQMNDMPFIQNEARQRAQSAQTMSIIALIITVICCPLIGIVLAILSLVNAAGARSMAGYDMPETKTARILSIITLIVVGVQIILSIVYTVAVFTNPAFWDAYEDAMSRFMQ